MYLSNNQREDKAGSSFDENVPIEIHGNTVKNTSVVAV